jgi:hypothetical protein
MIVFKNKDEYKIQDMNYKEKTVSTLLIPECILEFFLKRRNEEHGRNTAVYLRNLLSMYRIITHSGMLPKPRKIKTEYQKEKQNLQRISFRPGNSDWIELGELSIAFGKSRCWLFTYLLQLDYDGLWEILSKFFNHESVPTTPSLELKSYWTLQRYFHDFARGYHVKV